MAKSEDREPATCTSDEDHSPAFLRRFFAMAIPFFNSEERWTARLLGLGVLGLTMLQIGIAIRLNIWNRDFFNALEGRDWKAFLSQMWLFALLCAAAMATAVYQVYLKQLLQLRWRRWLTLKLVNQWLTEARHYHLNFIAGGVDNPDQRIAENTKHATEMAVEFALGVLNSALTLVSFVGILWTLSGVLDIALGTMDLKIPGYMVFAALLYAGVGSGLTYLVGRPIVAANIRQNATEADYRFSLVRLRENSEAVALIRGEADEEKGLSGRFGDVLAATVGLMRTQRRLMWLTSFYASVGIWVALVSKVLVITGGPGVGKTTLVNSILKILLVEGRHVALCAPTGRAAKRLSESTGLRGEDDPSPAGGRSEHGGFRRNEDAPARLRPAGRRRDLDGRRAADARAAAGGAAARALILVGDVDQLPSVGPGQVLADIIGSGAVPVVRLTEVFRQAAESRIIVNAHRINQGQMPDWRRRTRPATSTSSSAPTPRTGLRKLLQIVRERIPARFGLDPIRDIQVLCPMNRGGLGARSLNIELQQALNPPGELAHRALRLGPSASATR